MTATASTTPTSRWTKWCQNTTCDPLFARPSALHTHLVLALRLRPDRLHHAEVVGLLLEQVLVLHVGLGRALQLADVRQHSFDVCKYGLGLGVRVDEVACAAREHRDRV